MAATVAQFTNGSWETVGAALVSDGAAWYARLAFDARDNPFVVYQVGL